MMKTENVSETMKCKIPHVNGIMNVENSGLSAQVGCLTEFTLSVRVKLKQLLIHRGGVAGEERRRDKETALHYKDIDQLTDQIFKSLPSRASHNLSLDRRVGGRMSRCSSHSSSLLHIELVWGVFLHLWLCDWHYKWWLGMEHVQIQYIKTQPKCHCGKGNSKKMNESKHREKAQHIFFHM